MTAPTVKSTSLRSVNVCPEAESLVPDLAVELTHSAVQHAPRKIYMSDTANVNTIKLGRMRFKDPAC